jgi:hypothetical protein
MTMRNGLVALASLIAFAAPNAFAGTLPKQNAAPAAEQAPVEPYINADRERVAESGVCAPRVAYRGHRRVHLPLGECRPLAR